MKVFTYLPGAPHEHCPRQDTAVFIDAIAGVVLRFESLEDALQELQREGFIGEDPEKSFKGIKAFLEALEKKQLGLLETLCDQTNRDRVLQRVRELVEGLPLSTETRGSRPAGKPLDGDAVHAAARLVHENDLSRDRPVSVPKALDTAEALLKTAVLSKTLKRIYWGYDLASLDEGLFEEILGKSAAHQWRRIKQLPRLLIQSNVAESGPGGLSLTSHGLHKIAFYILRELFRAAGPKTAVRAAEEQGNTEPFLIHGTRPYRFGDHLHVNTTASLMNSLKRNGSTPPVHLAEQDFEVYQKEPVQRTATVVLLDMSKSMRMDNRYIAAKKVTLALCGMVRKRYIRDRIDVVEFSTKPRHVAFEEIPFLAWNNTNPYTNMEEAFLSAQKLLAVHKGYRKQVFLVTDGAPTAHREGDSIFFQYPAHTKTLQKTLLCADSLARHGICLSMFLLGHEKERLSFMHEMAKRARARLFHINPSDLGQCLLMDYVEKKRKWM